MAPIPAFMPRDDRKSHPCPCPWCPRSRCTCPEKGQWWSSALMNAVPRHTPESQWSEYADVYCKWLRSQQLIGLAPHVNHDVDGQHYPEQWSHLTNTNRQIATSCMHVLCLWQASKQTTRTSYENNLLHDAVVQVQDANEEALVARVSTVFDRQSSCPEVKPCETKGPETMFASSCSSGKFTSFAKRATRARRKPLRIRTYFLRRRNARGKMYVAWLLVLLSIALK